MSLADSQRYLELARAPLSFAPVVLEGAHLRLEPLSMGHHEALAAAGADESIWTWYPMKIGATGMRHFIEAAVQMQQQGAGLAFAYVLPGNGEVIGSSRYCSVDVIHRRAEIGWTWITPAHQRSVINTEAKYLMLQHAFETLQLIRVEFKTDSLNARSRAALARIGATEEGVFRKHMLTHSGRVRDSVYFSVTDQDWPRVKQHLQAKLMRSPAPTSRELP